MPAIAVDDLATQVDVPHDIFRLDNGLTVIVHSDHSVPTVFVGMWYGVGSKDEPEGKTGFAHLFEHLMFQGTANRTGEYFSPFTEAGATGMNGSTAEDRTNYYATVPSGALDMALWMESDRMSNLLGAITQEALDEQRDVVQNEKRQGETRPYAKMGDRIRAGLYPLDHPYRHSIIGSMDDLSSASLEDVHEWFRTYYGGSNAVLVLAGDVTLEDAKEKVRHYFSEAPPGKPLSQPKRWIPNLAQNREEVMYDNVGQTRLSRTWALPGLNDQDTTLMYLVNESLAGNKNSPLRKRLVDELQLATRVSGSAYGRVVSGEYNLTIDLRPDADPAEVNRVIDETITEYLGAGPDQDIVENAKLAVNMYMLGALESSSSIGRMLAEGYLYSGNPLFINRELAWLNAATAEELRHVADRWLTRGFYQLTVKPFPDYRAGEVLADRSTLPAVTADAEIEFPDIQTAMLKNGIKLVVARRGSIPLVDVSIRIDTGSTASPADAPGIDAFVFALLDKGTKQYDAGRLAAAKDRIGMRGAPRSGEERSSFDYRILRANLEASLELAVEILRNPTFPQEELDKTKARISAYLANLRLAPSRAAGAMFDRAIYGTDNPAGAVWTQELVDGVEIEDLREFHEREVAPDNMTLYMIGDIGIDEARQAVSDAFGKWKARHDSARLAIGKALEPRARVILIDHPGATSTTIYAGHAIGPYDPETATEISIMNQVLGGSFESRLNMNLREDKGWSYSYHSGIKRIKSGDQYFAANGQVQTDKTAESMREIRKEFADFVGLRPATAAEVDRMKLNRTRSLPGLFSTNRGFLGSIVRADSFGLPYDYAASSARRLQAVTVAGVNRRARSIINPDTLTWLVVGDLAEIEDGIRALNYGETEVWSPFGEKLR
jgi:zinc protease